eukprot:323906-Pleurochrysis_carterae.AAC.4
MQSAPASEGANSHTHADAGTYMRIALASVRTQAFTSTHACAPPCARRRLLKIATHRCVDEVREVHLGRWRRMLDETHVVFKDGGARGVSDTWMASSREAFDGTEVEGGARHLVRRSEACADVAPADELAPRRLHAEEEAVRLERGGGACEAKERVAHLARDVAAQ